MKRYDLHHPQVVASQPWDGFWFEPVTNSEPVRANVQREAPGPLLPARARPGDIRNHKETR